MNKQISYIIATVLMLALGQSVGAIGRATSDPVILSAELDIGQHHLIISGKHFGKTAPLVTIGGHRLEVSEFSPEQVVVTLSANLRPATYRLSVSNTQDPGRATFMYLQIPAAHTEQISMQDR